MNLPFTPDQFLDVFGLYNTTVWPAQIFILLLAIVSIFFSAYRIKSSSKIISVALSIISLWIGIVYHSIFFATINKAAYAFAVLFVMQGLMFFYFGVIKNSLNFIYKSKTQTVVVIILFLYALIFYPLLGVAFGHSYPRFPTFGLPCPSTIFTFGLILLIENKIKRWLIVIPVIWSLIGFMAAIKLGILQDVGLLASAIIVVTYTYLEKNAKPI
jgi:hypothetical protein